MNEVSLEEQITDLRRVKRDLERENAELQHEATKKADSSRRSANRANKLESSLRETLAELRAARHQLDTSIAKVGRMLDITQWEGQ